MKKNYLFILFLFFNICITHAQVQEWVWANTTIGTEALSQANAVAVAPDGSVYSGGSFMLSTITLGTETITNTGNYLNPFLVKYNSDGVVEWTKGVSVTSETSFITGITTDVTGFVYVIGRFLGAVGFDDFSLTNATYSSFIAKFDSQGNALWLKQVGIGEYSTINDIKIIGDLIYVAGNFSESISFPSETLAANGEHDIYIAQYDLEGNQYWASSFGGTGNDYNPSIAIDSDMNIYVTGTFKSSLLTFAGSTMTNQGETDIFLVKYDNLHQPQWIKTYGSTSNDTANSLEVDVFDNLFASYTIRNSINIEGENITAVGYHDSVIVKYNPAGDFLWYETLSGPGTEIITDIITNSAGQLFLTGSTYSDTISFANNEFELPGISRMFLSMLNSDGSFGWFVHAGGMDGTEAYSIDLHNSTIVVSGQSMEITFGNTTLNTGYDMYVAKFLAEEELGIKDYSYPHVTVYPNPAKNTIQIDGIPNLPYTIFDLSSRTIAKGIIKENSIDVSILPSGIYLLNVNNSTTKFIKE